MNAPAFPGRNSVGRRPLPYLAAVFLFWFSHYLYMPSLPGHVLARTGSLAAVGTVLSMYGLWMTLSRFPMGLAVDALGRPKTFLLAGFTLGALGVLLMGLSTAVPGLMVGRSLTGISMATWVPLVVIFSGLFPPGEAVRATALLTLVSSAARVSASTLNGLVVGWGGTGLPFLGAALLFLPAAALLLTVRPAAAPLRPFSPGGVIRLLARRDVLLPSLQSILLQYVSFGVSLGFLPILARRLGAGDMAVSLLVGTNLLAMTAGNLAAASLSGRLGAGRLLAGSYLLLVAGTLPLVLRIAPGGLYALQAVLGLAHGMGVPVLMGLSIRGVENGERSTAMGLFQSVYSTGMFLGPWASGLLAQALGLRAMFGCTAALCLAGGAAAVLANRLPLAAGGPPPGRFDTGGAAD